jgi:transglutaminase-like putative cysteine protease
MVKTGALVIILAVFALNSGNAANSEVVKYSTTIDIVNRKSIKTDTVIIRILNRSGEDYGNVSIPYYKDNPITNLKAWILDRNGNIVRYLKNKEISDANTISSSLYTDYYTKTFTIKHNDYPYYIAYTYQTTLNQYLEISDWHPVIDLDVPTLSASLTFRHPEGLVFNIIQNHINNPEIVSISGIIIQRWNAVYDGKLHPEVFSSDPGDYLPSVQIIPVEFEYGLPGSMYSWQTFGEWQSRLIAGLDDLPESEKIRVQSRILNITDKKEKIRALYHYLQDNTRYVYVQIGIGGLKPYSASYVAQNKFGDCKALSVYMKALLKYAGIESYYVLVNASEFPTKFYHEIPFLQFNHAMLAVPVDNDTIWLENTSNTRPFAYSGIFTQNRPALLIDGMNSRLVNIPPIKYERIINSRKFQFDITEDAGTNVKAIFKLKGARFEAYNNILINFAKDEQEEEIQKLLPFPAFDLHDWKMTKNGRDADSIIFMVEAEINQIVNPIGDQYYFSIQQIGISDIEMPQERTLPLYIPYPIAFHDTLTYKLPAKNKFMEVPDDKLLENKYGKYSITFKMEDNLLSVYRQLVLNPVQLSKDEYPDFYKLIASIKTHEKLKILFQ